MLIAVSLSAIAIIAVHVFISLQIAQQLFEARRASVLASSTSSIGQAQSTLAASTVQDAAGLQLLTNSILRSVEVSSGSQQVALLRSPGLSSDTAGQDVLSSGLDQDIIPDELRERVRQTPEAEFWQSISLSDGSPGLVVGAALNVPVAGAHEIYVVYSLAPEAASLQFVQWMLALAATVLLVLIAAIIWTVVAVVLRPVRRTAAASRRLADGHLDERLPTAGADEIATLGRSFNSMASSIQSRIEELRRLSALQQRFVSDVSHELRTPLTTIRMASDVLSSSRSGMSQAASRSAELLDEQVERFETLLADLLEVSRYDAGAATVAREDVDVPAAVAEVVAALEPVAVEHGVEIRQRADPASFVAEVDPRRFDRVVRNLLANAIEHGAGHPVIVRTLARHGALAVIVRDRGPGLPEEDLRHVFERFWRGTASRTRTLGGTGLGLSIAMEDAHLHGGTIRAWSEPGRGACFALVLPLEEGGPLDSGWLVLPGSADDEQPPAVERHGGEDTVG